MNYIQELCFLFLTAMTPMITRRISAAAASTTYMATGVSSPVCGFLVNTLLAFSGVFPEVLLTAGFLFPEELDELLPLTVLPILFDVFEEVFV